MSRMFPAATSPGKVPLHLLSAGLLALCAGCDGDGDGADEDDGAFQGVAVVGTTHEDAECDGSGREFEEACEQQGGVITDRCEGPYCAFELTCAETPAPLAEGQFACGPAAVCDAGQICDRIAPPGDGCRTSTCRPITGCPEPTCDCVLDVIEAGGDRVTSCTADGDGHVTVVRQP